MAGSTGIFSNHRLVGEADIQFLRTISWTAEGAADVNECMLAAQQCGTGDDALKWYETWDTLARKTYAEATVRLDTNPVGAASSLLRTCNYARTSAFFLRGNLAETERVRSAYALSNEAFGLAAPRLATPLTPTSIPMSDGSMQMPAYFARAPAPPVGRDERHPPPQPDRAVSPAGECDGSSLGKWASADIEALIDGWRELQAGAVRAFHPRPAFATTLFCLWHQKDRPL